MQGKLLERFKMQPIDFTFEELVKLLNKLGYKRINKDRMYDFRIILRNKVKRPVMIHKPYPGKNVKEYVMQQVYNDLENVRYLKEGNMEELTYKGYIGSMCYSEKERLLYGKIERINGLVNYEGEGVSELIEAFHQAVDDYLRFCEEENIIPD